MPVLSTHNLSIGYTRRGTTNVVQQALNLELNAGELVCLIGPNGSGKSTLMKTITGLLKSLKGKIEISGRELQKLSQHELSLNVALVLTDRVEVENATVYDIVAFGRHPYSNWWGNKTDEDNSRIQEAIDTVHLNHKKEMPLTELSDGEKQRVMIAKALAQDTSIILLDEPTAHLDLPNRVEIMLLLHRLAHTTGKAILLSTHELDMALQAADRIWLMSENGVESGIPEDLVFNGSFNRVFESKYYYFNTSNGNFSMNYPMSKKVKVTGDKTRLYWTLRALARAGFMVVEDAPVHVEILTDKWLINGAEFHTVESLLNALNSF